MRYCWYWIRMKLYILIKSDIYYWIFGFFVAANSIIMATEYHGYSQTHEEFIKASNILFTIIFILELLLKILALGFKGYAADNFNLFDCLLVFIGIIELYLVGTFNDHDSIFYKITKMARIFRFFKLAKR